MRIPRALLAGLVWLQVGGPASLTGQTPSAAVTGRVQTDSAPLAEAEITATNESNGYRYVGRSDETGRFWLRGLAPGTYTITARRIGFVAATHSGVALPVGSTVTVRFQLETSAVRLDPIVTVTRAPIVETTQSDVSYTLSQRQIADLPEESRQFVDLAQLAPGATTAYETPEGVASTSIGALNSYSVGILVDGGSFIRPGLNAQAGSVPLLAIQEFEVLTSGYSAEYGQAASGVINAVTRSGSNRLTVEALTRYRHRALNATGALESVKPDFNRMHAGVAVGGPLARDRTHAFVAVERRVENLFPTVETGGALPALEGSFKAPFTQNLLFARLDHHLDDRQEFTVRYLGELSNRRIDLGGTTVCSDWGPSPVGAEDFGVDVRQTMHSGLASYRRRIGETGLAESRVHVIRSGEDRDRLTTDPAMIRPTACSGGNYYSWLSNGWRVEANQDFSFATAGRTGTHRFKFGVLAAWVQMYNLNRNFAHGAFSFADDTDSLPLSFLQSLDTAEVRLGNGQFGLYVQDEWSPTANLTFQLGLRYDIETNATNQGYQTPDAANFPFLSSEARPADTDNISPRLGFAWDPAGDGRTVVRGGFGIFYNQFTMWYSAVERIRSRLVIVFGPGTTDASQVPIPPDVPPFAILRGNEVPAPFTRQVSLGIERIVGGGIVLRVDGLLIEGRNIPILRALQTVPVPRYPDYSVVDQVLNRGEANAKMLVLRAAKRFDRGSIDVHYTLANRTATNDWWFQSVPQNDPDSEDFSGELGPAGWDERHRVVALGTAGLPGDFRVSGKAVYASARPFNAVTRADTNGDNRPNDRPAGEGRNGRRGPDFLSVDVGIARTFRPGNGEIDLVLNVYNLLNRDNFTPTSVIGDISHPLFGQALGAYANRQAEIGLQVRY